MIQFSGPIAEAIMLAGRVVGERTAKAEITKFLSEQAAQAKGYFVGSSVVKSPDPSLNVNDWKQATVKADISHSVFRSNRADTPGKSKASTSNAKKRYLQNHPTYGSSKGMYRKQPKGKSRTGSEDRKANFAKLKKEPPIQDALSKAYKGTGVDLDIANFGVTSQFYLQDSSVTESTHSGLFGYPGQFRPMGHANNPSAYSAAASNTISVVMARARGLGYKSTVAVDDIRTAVHKISDLLQAYYFLEHVHTMLTCSTRQMSIAQFLEQKYDNSLTSLMVQLRRVLETLPYPESFHSMLTEGLGATYMGNYQDAPIAMFMPQWLLPALSSDAMIQTNTTPVAWATSIQAVISDLFSDQLSMEIIRMMTKIFPTIKIRDVPTDFPYKGQMMNNIANLPMFNSKVGGYYEPNENASTQIRLFFYEEPTPYGFLTISSDDYDHATAENPNPYTWSVWQSMWTVADGTTVGKSWFWLDTNSAPFKIVDADADVFLMSGRIWENETPLSPGLSPAIIKKQGSPEQVHRGLIRTFLNI